MLTVTSLVIDKQNTDLRVSHVPQSTTRQSVTKESHCGHKTNKNVKPAGLQTPKNSLYLHVATVSPT